MQAGSKTTRVDAPGIDAPRIDAEGRLPWKLAIPLIGCLSLVLWVGIWQLARLALAF